VQGFDHEPRAGGEALPIFLLADGWAQIFFNQRTVLYNNKHMVPSLHIHLCHMRSLGGLAANTLDTPCTHAHLKPPSGRPRPHAHQIARRAYRRVRRS
jgi:hypothetical protein